MFSSKPLYYEVLPKRLLMIGGGSSGASGTSDWPDYMKAMHQAMLNDMRDAVGGVAGSPPAVYVYDPKVWFGLPDGNSVYAALTKFSAVDIDALITAIMANDNFLIPPDDLALIKAKATALRDELISDVPYGSAVEDLIDAHSVKLLEKVNSEVLPKIEVGMRDLNAVIGSSFVIAKEIAMEQYTSEIADFSTKVRVSFWEKRHELYKFTEDAWIRSSLQASELAYKYAAMQMEKLKLEVSMAAEIGNAAVLAQSKYGVVSTEASIRGRTWRVEMNNYMNKTLAAISGASPVSTRGDQSTASAMFSGGLGMAAMGAGVGGYLGAGSTLGGLAGGATAGGTLGMAGGPAGAVIGGVIGLGVGMISGLLKK